MSRQRRARWVAIVGALAALAAFTVAPASAAQADPPPSDAADKATELTMVRFAPGTPPARAAAVARSEGGAVLDTQLGVLGVAVVQPARSDFASRVKRHPGVVATWKPTLVRYDTHEAPPRDGNDLVNAPDQQVPAFPDPLHDAASFFGETNPRGVLQWDDIANGATDAWPVTRGDAAVRVAVIDTGVDAQHRELQGQVEASYNLLPCQTLEQVFGKAFDPRVDCQMADGDGHGTWVAGRIAAAANGFASNGIAPNVRILSYKALSTSLGGGATAWIVGAMVHACFAGHADVVNLSLGGYINPADPDQVQDYLLWVDAVEICRQRGVAVIAAAGNDHVRVDRVDVTVGGRELTGVGQVAAGADGYTFKGSPAASDPKPGYLEAPAGVPGVLMVSAINNATAPPTNDVPAGLRPPPDTYGRFDQLAYYSNYGSRVDVAAPGGARKFNLPRADGGPNNFLLGGWGMLGTAVANGRLCAVDGAVVDFACFLLDGQAFAWLQGSSMSAPNASGVAALVLSARPDLRQQPDQLLSRLQSTARTDMANATPPLSPSDTQPSYDGTACPTGYCHLDWAQDPISFSDAYGAGMVNAGAAIADSAGNEAH